MTDPHRKQIDFTLAQKKSLLAVVNKNDQTRKKIADEFGISVAAVSVLAKNSRRIEDAIANRNSGKCKKLQSSKNADVGAVLLQWFRQACAGNVPISGLVMREKVLELAVMLKNEDFGASKKWFERLRRGTVLPFFVSPATKPQFQREPLKNGSSRCCLLF